MDAIREKIYLNVKRDCFKDTLIKMKRYRFLYLLIMPAIILTLVFQYLPMLGVIIAFQDFDIIRGVFNSEFVGFKNFITVLTYPKFLEAIKNTLIFSSVNLFLGFPFPIILALLFNEIRSLQFKKVIQTISYLPHFLSWISVIGMFYTIFAKDGIFNDVMQMLFGNDYVRTNILMKSDNFLAIIFGSGLWKNIGWSTVIFLAAIAGVDGSQYEAATVDGCNRFKQVFYITLPSIMPTIVIVLILSMGNLVSVSFEQVFGFQNIYTQERTEVINTLVFRQGIQNGQYGLSTALGIMQGGVSFLIVYVSNAIIKKLSGTGIW